MAPRTFLILEKDGDLRSLHRLKLLKQFPGCSVLEVASCAAALTALERFPADAVVVNQSAQDCSGLEALARLRRDHPGLPLISVGPVDVEHAALEHGATRFLDDRHWEGLGAAVHDVLPPR